ncbi:AzlD domain-containing protein [Salinarimonas sp.]|uniref:AzlD family protein n=1 Tax=Salinarimonas sp. TaxID=2766526 RepID=UPI0032D95B14
MTALEGLLAGPAGDYVAVALMTVATYLCRASGIVFMSRMRITPRIERALRALPGSIVIATILPVAAQAGFSAILGLAAAIAVMTVTRIELAGVAAGLAAVSLARLVGL